MRVSVIIPAYKAANTICRAVDSVLAQTYPATEIIIVDDGSPDDQADVIERNYGDVPQVILLRQPNGRTAQARNAGIERATGEFIAFLDADDYWEPEKLSLQLQVFDNNPDVGLVAGKYYNEHPGTPRVASAVPKGSRRFFQQVLSPRGEQAFRLATMTWTGTVLIRRDAIGLHRFQSGLEPAEDRDFWVRIISEHPVYLLDTPLATAVIEDGSLSRSGIARDCSNMLQVIDRHAPLLGTFGTRLWRSYTLFRWAANEPIPKTALRKLLESYWHWPIPYGNRVPCPPHGRLKRLLVLCNKLFRSPRSNNLAT